MKRVVQHPENTTEANGRHYWRSFAELEETPEFSEWLEREFPRGAAELNGPESDEVSRRGFLKYMGAATALAGFGMAGCRRPEALLLPYAKHVEWAVPGKALLYASAMPRATGCTPLVVTTFSGRPTKVDGNPLHPDSAGGSDALAQASILSLYDPDRSKNVLAKGKRSTRAKFDAFLRDLHRLPNLEGGKGMAFLVGEGTSPTRARLMDEVTKKFPKAVFYRYEPVGPEPLRRATRKAFGPGVTQRPRFDRADKVLSLNCDFLGVDELGGDTVNAFSRRRKLAPGNNDASGMNRLYVVEPGFTLTGGMADHRLRTHASQTPKVAALFAKAIADETGDAALAAAVEPLLGEINTAVFDIDWITTSAKDLVASKGKSLVVAGPRQPAELHLLVARINEALGAFGGGKKAVVELLQSGETSLPGIGALASAMTEGKVKTLFVTTEADPLYDAPANLKFGELYKKVPTTVHLGARKNVTARASTWHVPATHYLEEWGDVLSAGGAYSVVQPMILPLYGDCASELELLLGLLHPPAAPEKKGDDEAAAPMAAAPNEPTPPPMILNGFAPELEPGPVYPEVRKTFATFVKGGDVEEAWNHTLRDGVLAKTAYAPAPAASVPPAAAIEDDRAFRQPYPFAGAMEIVFATDSRVHDGRYANNGWLQEVPDPITKLTWDNAALISQQTAADLGVKGDGQMLEVELGGNSMRVPALIVPGQADHALTIALGYGQENAGIAASGVGFNAYPLRRSGIGEYVVSGAAVTATKKTYELALTAEHYSMEGRAIARETTAETLAEHDWKHDPEGPVRTQGMDAHIPPVMSLYEGPDYMNPDSPRNVNSPAYHKAKLVDPHHQWGMTIDLNSCIGCNACVVACQAENNIPIVGKDQVIKGREMHWIRMDRYFSSAKEDLTWAAKNLSAASTGNKPGEERGRPKVDDDRVEMIQQPVACVHCESAPCETVCPVNATVHTPDGLNAMAYNRCIGTRYCANNCPYKARRFNFFDYNKRPLDRLYEGPLAPAKGRGTTSERLQKNPNVSVRMRGVIEKCTYCVQRLTQARITAKKKAGPTPNVQVAANSVRTACQDACPAEAIVFGNLKNEKDEIGKWKDSVRNYDLLKYVGTVPRTSYLARVRNPNPEMPDAAFVGQATANMH